MDLRLQHILRPRKCRYKTISFLTIIEAHGFEITEYSETQKCRKYASWPSLRSQRLKHLTIVRPYHINISVTTWSCFKLCGCWDSWVIMWTEKLLIRLHRLSFAVQNVWGTHFLYTLWFFLTSKIYFRISITHFGISNILLWDITNNIGYHKLFLGIHNNFGYLMFLLILEYHNLIHGYQ